MDSEAQPEPSEKCSNWKQEMELHNIEVEALQKKLHEMKNIIHHSQESSKDKLEFLWRRVRTTATLLTYLKSKACLMSRISSDLSKNADVAAVEKLSEEELLNDGLYINQVLKSVQMVKDVMESLATRVLVAETKVSVEKEKVSAGKEEIRKKSLQIELMSAKAQEMEKFALGTHAVLNEMRQKIKDLVEETSRQRLRAVENEQELSRVKRDFDLLKSYVCRLIGVREALIPLEESQTEDLLRTLVDRGTRLENEKSQKEAEVQSLMVENGRLNALLDEKEVQLLALNEQCKFMALRMPDA